MFLDVLQKNMSTPCWRLRDKADGDERKVSAVLESEHKETKGDLAVVINNFVFDEGRAKRIFVRGENRFGLLLETFHLKEPQCVYTTFEIPTQTELVCNVANKNRLVFRTKKQGCKFFRILSETDGQDSLEESGLLYPDGFLSDNTMKITPYTGLYTYAKNQISVYAIIQENSIDIRYWHIKNKDNGFVVADPKNVCCYDFTLQDNILKVQSMQTDTCIIINLEDEKE